MTEAQKRAKAKYQSKVKRLTIDFYPPEADLLEHIEKQPKKQTYIKDLIRADIAVSPLIETAIRAERESALIRTKAMMESHEKWKANHPRPKHDEK